MHGAGAGAGSPASASASASASSPVHEELSRSSYMADVLSGAEARGFKAAGVLVYKRDRAWADGGVCLLLGREGAPSKSAGRLNILGGKLDPGETALHTAARELWEESGALLAAKPQDLHARLQQDQVMWYRDSKYALHFLEIQGPEEESICERYAALKSRDGDVQAGNAAAAAGSATSEMLDLHWVGLGTLLEYLNTQLRRPAQAKCDDQVTTLGGLSAPMISFTLCMLNQPVLRAKLERMLENSGPLAARQAQHIQAQAAAIRAQASPRRDNGAAGGSGSKRGGGSGGGGGGGGGRGRHSHGGRQPRTPTRDPGASGGQQQDVHASPAAAVAGAAAGAGAAASSSPSPATPVRGGNGGGDGAAL